MIHVEEADARHTHQRAAQVAQLAGARLFQQIVEHAPGGREILPVWRHGVPAEVGIVRFHDEVIAGVVRILENNVHVVIALTFDAPDSADDLIDQVFFLAYAVIEDRAAPGMEGIESGHGRVNDRAKLNAAGRGIAKALHMRATEGTARSAGGQYG